MELNLTQVGGRWITEGCLEMAENVMQVKGRFTKGCF